MDRYFDFNFGNCEFDYASVPNTIEKERKIWNGIMIICKGLFMSMPYKKIVELLISGSSKGTIKLVLGRN